MTAPLQMSMTAVWLAAMIVLLIVEGMAPGLVCIWFAFGALGALIAALLNMRVKQAAPAILVGVCIAAAIMTAVTYGVIRLV